MVLPSSHSPSVKKTSQAMRAALSERQLGWNSRGVSSLLTVWRLPIAFRGVEDKLKCFYHISQTKGGHKNRDPIESFEIVGVVIGGAAKAISSIRSRSSNSARNTTQQVDSSAANTSIVEKVADIVEKTNRSLPCENDVSGHKQRYHTKNGVIWKNKAPYHRGGNNG